MGQGDNRLFGRREMLGGACALPLATLSGCGSLPADDAMVAHFRSHRRDFEALLRMALAERVVNRVSYNFFWPAVVEAGVDRDTLLPKQRWNAYRKLFNRLDLAAGIGIEHGKSVDFWYRTSGFLSVSARYKGYLWSRDTPRPLAADTELDAACSNGDCAGFRQVEPGWFIYFQAT
jgi:hypothetical protein